jgi:hypothetical protein
VTVRTTRTTISFSQPFELREVASRFVLELGLAQSPA